MKIAQDSGVPIYQQIATQLRADILSGDIQAGEYLPSIRGLAKDLKISVITTMKAYEQLEEEGLVAAVQGKGFIVKERDEEMIKEQYRKETEDYLMSAIESAKLADISEEELITTLKLLMSV